MEILVVHNEIRGSLRDLNCLVLGTLKSNGIWYQIEFGRPKTHIRRVPCEFSWGLFVGIVGNLMWKRP
jgi:hypothetical protein